MSIFIYIITIDWRMALASLLTIPIALIAYAFVLRTFNKKYEDYMNANNHVNSVIVEYVEGIQVIKAFNQSASSYEKFEQAVKMFLDYTLDWYRSTWKPMNFWCSSSPFYAFGNASGWPCALCAGVAPACRSRHLHYSVPWHDYPIDNLCKLYE